MLPLVQAYPRGLVAGALLAVSISPGMANDGLVVGLTTDQLLTCGRFFVERVEADSKTFYKFASALEGLAVVQVASEESDGCEATAAIENGKVSSLQTRQFNQSVFSRCACLHVFSECKYLRR